MYTLMQKSGWGQYRAAVLFLSCFLLGLPSGALSHSGTIATFDPPGATSTYANSINEEGAIAGYYYDANFISHGFVRDRHGTIITFVVPDASYTYANSINEEGAVVGSYSDATSQHGFLRSQRGTITTFDAPGASQGTFAVSINEEGAIAGGYVDASF